MNHIINKITYYLHQAGVDETLVNDSIWRVQNDFFEFRHAYLERGEVILLVGGDKNLALALLAAYTFPFAEIVLVETHLDLIRKIKHVCELLKISNLIVEIAYHNALNLIGARTVGWCLVDAETEMDIKQLENILHRLNIRQIAGEFDEVSLSASSLRSLLVKKVERYYFRVYGTAKVFTGRGNKKQNSHSRPDISVIVPLYNAEKYLPYCIASLTQPSRLNLEILIINDGSTDNSGAIAREFERGFSNIQVINKPNGGCASSRSAGLRIASGEYVAFIDSDDWVDQGMYDDLFDSALTYQSDIVYCGFRKVNMLDNLIVNEIENVRCSLGNCNGLVEDISYLYLLQPSIWRSIFKRSFLQANMLDFPQAIRRFDDLYFTFVTLSMADRVSFVPRFYYNYRLGRVGQDVAANDERLYVHFEIFDLLKDYISELGDARMEWRLKSVELNTHTWGYHKIIPRLRWSYLSRAAANFSKTIYISRLSVPGYAYKHFGVNRANLATLLTLLG